MCRARAAAVSVGRERHPVGRAGQEIAEGIPEYTGVVAGEPDVYAARWHAVPTQARLATPADNPPPQPLSPVSKQAPTASAAPATSAPSATSADSGNSQAARSGKKDDIDTLIDKVPELRKRLGF